MNAFDILNHYKSNSKAENNITQFILKNPEIFLNSTSKELAILTYSSAPTIIRLVRKMGFSGYQDLKIKIALAKNAASSQEGYLDHNLPFSDKDNLNDIINNISQVYISTVKETSLSFDHKKLQSAIDTLYNSSSIDIYGAEININLAYDFAYKLRRIDKKVELSSEQRTQFYNAAKANATHCALFISYSGDNNSLIECAKILKETAIPIILITGNDNSQLSKISDIVLGISSHEVLYSKIGTFSSKYSIGLILDILFSGFFSKDYQSNKKQIEKISNAMKSKS